MIDEKKIEDLKKELNLAKARLSSLEGDREKLEKTLKIGADTAVGEERSRIEEEYKKRLLGYEKVLKETTKTKAKTKGEIVKNRVEKAIKNKKESIYYLKRSINNIIKSKNLSPLVNTEAFFLIINPKKIEERIKGLVMILIIIIILPSILCFLIYKGWTIWIKIMIFICNFFVWGLLYLAFAAIAKCDEVTSDEIGELRRDIKENKKDIRKIKNDIKKEKIEDSAYLKIDKEIDKIKKNIDNLKKEKKATLDNFDKEVAEEIKSKIEKESTADFKNNEKDIKKAKKTYDDLLDKYEKAKAQYEKESKEKDKKKDKPTKAKVKKGNGK